MPLLDRRQFLRATGAAAGAFLLAGTRGAAAEPLGGVDTADGGASRESPLVPGRVLVHSDLHNHSLLSDGDGDPAAFYPAMVAAGLDVACLTDHAIMGKYHGEVTCRSGSPCSDYVGINETRWQQLRELADAHLDEGRFVTFPAFEWSSATVGHTNVWFSSEWIDAVWTGSLISPRATRELRNVGPLPPELIEVFNSLPDTASIEGFYDWLAAQPGSEPFGGGADAIVGFNHPNEFGDFEGFAYREDVAARVVSCEALNGDRDFFHFTNEDDRSPYALNACLNAGWHVGLLGVSDEHSTEYARPGMARGGLWVRDLTRAGVREAMESRAMFATFEPGLRLAATANGVRMGSLVQHVTGPVTIDLDVDRGPGWRGRPLVAQVVRPGESEPVLADAVNVTAGRVNRFRVSVDVDDGDWLFVRIVDPERPAADDLPSPWRDAGGVVAYASPFFFRAEGARGAGGAPGRPGSRDGRAPAGGSAGAGRALPATGGGAGLAASAVLAAAAWSRRGSADRGTGSSTHAGEAGRRNDRKRGG